MSQITGIDTTEETGDEALAGVSTATVTIEKVVTGGLGLARLDGRVLLVPLTAPGDVAEVEVPDRGSEARLVRLVAPGPDRHEPPCPHYGVCGGCDLMHLTYEAQAQIKLEATLETIQRIGGSILGGAGEVEMVPNPAPLYSRIRATWRDAPNGRLGYLRRGSRDVVAVDNCLILEPVLEGIRRTGTRAGEVHALTNGIDVSHAGGASLASPIEFEILGERILASADAFFQANGSLLEPFVRYVVEASQPGPEDAILELYSGVGLFTVPLARRSGQLDAVESSAAAVALARRNLDSAGITGAVVHQASVEKWLRRNGTRAYQTVVVDPPRAGLGRAVVDWLISTRTGRVTYASCDPATFARDARALSSSGYQVESLRVFDLFPQTHHVELVAAFRFDR